MFSNNDNYITKLFVSAQQFNEVSQKFKMIVNDEIKKMEDSKENLIQLKDNFKNVSKLDVDY